MAKTTSTRKKAARGNSCLPTGKKGCAPLESVSGTPAPESQAYARGREYAHPFLDQFALDEQADAIRGFRDGVIDLLSAREKKHNTDLELVGKAIEQIER